jgi:hypothetical protein
MLRKNHKKLDNTVSNSKIQAVISYCYLGVDIDYLKSMT